MPSSADREHRQYVNQRHPLDAAGTARRLQRFIEAHRQTCTWFHLKAAEGHAYGGGAGDQWDHTVLTELEQTARPALVVDKVSTTIDALAGRLQTERFRAQIAPEGVDEPLAGPLDQYSNEMRRRSGGEAQTGDAFRDMWLARVGWTRLSLRYRGPTPEEVREVIPIWEMIWDTRARKQNLTDRRGHCHARYVNATEFRAKFGDPKVPGEGAISETFSSLWDRTGGGGSTDWPQTIQESWNVDEETVFLKTFEWRDTEPFFYLRLPESLDGQVAAAIGDRPHDDPTVLRTLTDTLAALGPSIPQMMEEPSATLGWPLTEPDFKSLEQVWLKVTGEAIPPDLYQKLNRERYYRAHMVGDAIVGDVELIPEQKFTFIALTDNMVKSPTGGHRPRSYVESMKDRQDAMNKALSGLMESAMTSVKSAFLTTTGFFKDPGRAEEKLVVPGSVVEVQKPITPENFQVLQSKPNEVYQRIYELLQQIFAEEIQSPYETGGVEDLRRTSFKTVSSVTQNARGKQASRFQAYSIALREEVVLQISQAWAYVPWEQMIDIVGAKFAEVLPQDRRWWLYALRHQVAIVESPYTAVESDDLFAKLNESGFWQMLMQYLPPESAVPIMLELMPAGIAARAPRAFQMMQEVAQAMAQPPPQPPAEGEPPPEPPPAN